MFVILEQSVDQITNILTLYLLEIGQVVLFCTILRWYVPSIQLSFLQQWLHVECYNTQKSMVLSAFLTLLPDSGTLKLIYKFGLSIKAALKSQLLFNWFCLWCFYFVHCDLFLHIKMIFLLSNVVCALQRNTIRWLKKYLFVKSIGFTVNNGYQQFQL